MRKYVVFHARLRPVKSTSISIKIVSSDDLAKDIATISAEDLAEPPLPLERTSVAY
jgi:hypothetical protein